MSLLPIRVDGTISCQTTQQLEQHAFTYVDTASSAISSEAGSLHSLVDLLTAARNDSNRFLTSMIAKYPKGQPPPPPPLSSALPQPQRPPSTSHSSRLTAALRVLGVAAVDKGGRRKKRDEDEEDEAVEEEQDQAQQLDDSTTSVTVPISVDPTAAPATSSNTATSEPEAKRPKLDNQ